MKHREIIEQMKLEEKAAFLSGKNEWETRGYERLGIPSVLLSDGPNGVRRQVGEGDHLGQNPSLPATCFPTTATVANSWNEELGEELGTALGEEAANLGVDVLLGPGLNMKRSPLCGRNFEYFSEDPYLAGKMAAAYIRGIQSQGVYACPKHFAANNQELRRMSVNSVLDERTLREIYLTGFEIAVKEGKAKSIMTSYNMVNGIYANENHHLLEDILREEWGFDGFVVTDWGGSNNHVEGVKAGSDLEMPSPGLDSARILLKAIAEGKLTEMQLDVCVDRLLDAVFELNDAKHDRMEKKTGQGHHALARRAAAESAVLLKNAEKILPLKAGTRVLIVGDFAENPRYQGAGSSKVNSQKVDAVVDMLGNYELEVLGVTQGYERIGGKASAAQREAMKKETLDMAVNAQVILYCFGLDETSEMEGMDRSHMKLPKEQTELLAALAEVNPNIVGILSAGSPVEMPWIGCLKALLHGYLYGESGAGAMLDILTGRVNPSGKLAETYPIQYADTPAYHYFPGERRNAEYREGIYIGYRYYDTAGVRVQYPFGYGLSYTTFAYEDLELTDTGVSFSLENIGQRNGAEIVQLYVRRRDGEVFRPAKELKGFKKVWLKAGERKTVHIPFDDKTFRYWNVKTGQWEVEGGRYEILVAASSEDIRLAAGIELSGTTKERPYEPQKLSSYYAGKVQQVSDAEFKELLGYPIPDNTWDGKLGLNDAVCQMCYARSGLARLVCKILDRKIQRGKEKGNLNLNLLFIYNIPFRGIAKMTEGMVSMEMAEGMVDVVNGHFLRGMKQVMAGFFRNRKENKKMQKKFFDE